MHIISWRSERTENSLGRAEFSKGQIFLKGKEESAGGRPELKREEGVQKPQTILLLSIVCSSWLIQSPEYIWKPQGTT